MRLRFLSQLVSPGGPDVPEVLKVPKVSAIKAAGTCLRIGQAINERQNPSDNLHHSSYLSLLAQGLRGLDFSFRF